ncbi:Transcriptional regulator/sugar kinase [Archaeoglobus sulfaticallidus PM70-1]|uniref:Transcriptional regulator/sugar kinase n=1 Tax=Archaeoglobus sulfaticallidus PM70-1 TaxID=387631 RepID=N0BJ82_9EURY|nr:ROK family protein [Archaeoglobus sulfaticallidus]AGK60230.1 Transcriptional regulator/sugar kinase [Archaeoglobus sulfaticallidus PM70-1]
MGFLGLDVGGTNTDVVLLDDSTFHHIKTVKTRDIIDGISDLISDFILDIIPEKDVKAVGIGIAAWIRDGKIFRAPNLPVIPNININLNHIIENDANCFAFFASKEFGFKDMIGITIGTGIGSGIILEGKLYRGKGLAGEIGHAVVSDDKTCVCGEVGHLEAHFGGWAIERDFSKPAEKLDIDIHSLSGFDRFCRAVAFAVMMMDFEGVVVGGRIGMSLSEKVLKKRISEYLMPEFDPEIKILKDELAVAKGSALLAKEYFG